MSLQQGWFVAQDGLRDGPFSLAELEGQVGLGSLKETDLVWRAGFTEWKPAAGATPLFGQPLVPLKVLAARPYSSSETENIEARTDEYGRQLTELISLVGLCVAALVLLNFMARMSTEQLLTDVQIFGWANLPEPHLAAFRWLNDNTVWLGGIILVAGLLANGIMIHNVASSLKRFGVAQHWCPMRTAASLVIPIWNLYRPWIGLCEVRNTLALIAHSGECPQVGLRGGNARTIVYGCTLALAGLVAQLIRFAPTDLSRSGHLTAPEGAILYLSEVSALQGLATLVAFVAGAATLWYWLDTLTLYNKAVVALRSTRFSEGECNACYSESSI